MHKNATSESGTQPRRSRVSEEAGKPGGPVTGETGKTGRPSDHVEKSGFYPKCDGNIPESSEQMSTTSFLSFLGGSCGAGSGREAGWEREAGRVPWQAGNETMGPEVCTLAAGQRGKEAPRIGSGSTGSRPP